MLDFVTQIIADMQEADYGEKRQHLELLVHVTETGKVRFSPEDRKALLAYTDGEVDRMLRDIPEAECYRQKDTIFECENFLLGLVMQLCPSPDALPEGMLLKIRSLTEMVNRERCIENTLDSIFEQPTIGTADINRLLYWVRQTADEYQKGKLYLGLIHYQDRISVMDAQARTILTDFVASELRRLADMAPAPEEVYEVLELIADVARHFADDWVIAGLQQLLILGRNHINYFAVDSLFRLGQEVPQQYILALGSDLEYANLVYGLLKREGKTALLPAELTGEEYLAKSDLVRWLTFPTELGKAPEEIEYIGKVKYFLKKEVFHVFRYHSDSDKLDDSLKNQWLIGWSSDDGGTFSNFDLYADYEKATVEATLKHIKKKLIGR